MTDIYDYVSADTIEVGDLVTVHNDPLEVSEVIDSGDSIMVKGYSHLTGDSAVYIVPATMEVGLWTA